MNELDQQRCDRCPPDRRRVATSVVECWKGCRHNQCQACADYTARERDAVRGDLQ